MNKRKGGCKKRMSERVGGEQGRKERKRRKSKVRKEPYTPHTLVPVIALMKVQFSCTSSAVTTSASPVEVS